MNEMKSSFQEDHSQSKKFSPSFSSDEEKSQTNSKSNTSLSSYDVPQPQACALVDRSIMPDHWIARDPRLIPLCGPHPFNAEPPLSTLMESGIITTNSLHYVRNHGTVPKLDAATHRLVVDGLVQSTLSLNLDQLKNDPRLEEKKVLNTMACDGNRRKEVNMLEHGRGFSWGPSVVGTAYWTGITLVSLLKLAGIAFPSRADIEKKNGEAAIDISKLPRYVCFEGAEMLTKGHYGTSIPLSWALDESRDMIIAYEMNNEALPPDHGFPFRIICPGMVGGRQVKWLKRITVSAYESPSIYHYDDNRVLPSHVTWNTAESEGWWYRPEYLLYDMNLNSVISAPEHNEFLSLGSDRHAREEELKIEHKDDQPQGATYRVRGYAYSGGGRRITQVEISLDEGKNWELVPTQNMNIPLIQSQRKRRNQIRNDSKEEKNESDNNSKEISSMEDLQDYMNDLAIKELQRQDEEKKKKEESKSKDDEKSSLPHQKPDHDEKKAKLDSQNNILICSQGPGSASLYSQDRDWRVWGNSKGKVWSWCHWFIDVPIWRLMTATWLCVRAFDEACNTQPSNLTWNILGQMNNAWYKLKVNIQQSGSSPLSLPTITFTHPVLPGNSPGGWMKLNDKNKALNQHQPRGLHGYSHPNIAPTAVSHLSQFTLEEVKKHNKMDDLWILIDSAVYDVTSYLRDHPAGAVPLHVVSNGLDASQLFYSIHAGDAFQIKDWFRIGCLVNSSYHQANLNKSKENANEKTSPFILNPKKWLQMKLIKKEDLSHDTVRFTLQYTGNKDSSEEKNRKNIMGIPCGSHVLIGASIEINSPVEEKSDNRSSVKKKKEWIVRPYTPTSPVKTDQEGETLDLVIKIYKKNRNPLFPQGGILTQYLSEMPIGSYLSVQGPAGHIEYRGQGQLLIHGVPIQVDRISLLAGGTGITPMYQLLDVILNDPKDPTQISLIFSNKTADDILLRKELDELEEKHGFSKLQSNNENNNNKTNESISSVCRRGRFHLWYSISHVPKDGKWEYGVGHVNEQMMRKHLFFPSPNNVVLLCGPPAFVHKACIPALLRLGYAGDQMIEY